MKGLTFSGPDDPVIPGNIRKALAPLDVERQAAYIREHNERWAIVGQCKVCGRDLITEEVQPHSFSHVSDGIRSVARMIAELTDGQRDELFEFFGIGPK